jgi:signal peptidase I
MVVPCLFTLAITIPECGIRTTMLSKFISNLRKQRLAAQSIVATIPFLIYFCDEYYSITYIRDTSMEPTIHHGDIVLIRKRDAGSVLLNLLYSIGYLKSSSPSPSSSTPISLDKSSNRAEVEEEEKIYTTRTSTKQKFDIDDDRIQALRYRIENINDNFSSNTNNHYWLISPSYLSPLILPGHVVLYQNPFRFQESVVKRVIGVGGQRIATLTTKAATDATTIQLPHDVIRNVPFVEGKNASIRTQTNKEHTVASSSSSDYPSLLQHLRRKHQEKKEMDAYYDVRLPPHTIYVESDNRASFVSTDDVSNCLERTQPISQNLMIGIAEYIIWPPSRFQRIIRKPVYETINIHNNTYNISRPRAIWD